VNSGIFILCAILVVAPTKAIGGAAGNPTTTSANNPPPGNPSANDIPLVLYESDAIEIELSFAHRDQITSALSYTIVQPV
jgi:hypothetical protein